MVDATPSGKIFRFQIKRSPHHVKLDLRSLEVSEIIHYKVDAGRERRGSLPRLFDVDFENVNVNVNVTERYFPALFCQPDLVSPGASGEVEGVAASWSDRNANSMVAMPRLTNLRSRSSGHNGSLLPPRTGGGDDDGHGSDGIPDSIPNYGERLRRARMGLAVAMTPILVLFVSFTAVYLIRRGFLGLDLNTMAYVRAWVPVRLPWMLLIGNTAVLIVSSVTIELARREITREAALAPLRSLPGISLGDERHFPWLALTTILGMGFFAGQLLVWKRLSGMGFHLTGGTSSSFVYVLTGMHGLHLAGGVAALLFANVNALSRRPVETRRIVVDIVSWYWHCMTGLWIYILVLFSFAAQ